MQNQVRNRVWSRLATVTVIAAAIPSLSYAAIEEIVVLAERREAKLQEVPIAVSALSSEDLQKRQAYNIENIGTQVPNLLSTKSSGSPTNLRVFMRGLGQSESTMPTAESAVGIYVDDVYMARTNGANLRLLDIERIEVLRGPQGTLYGRNTISGALKIVTRQPDEEVRADASIGFGSRNMEAKLGGSTPFANNQWAVGAAVVIADEDGFIDRYSALDTPAGRESGDRDYSGAQVDLRYMGSETFEAAFSFSYTDDNSDGLYATPLSTTGVPLTGGDLYTTLTTRDQFADNDAFGGSMTLTWHLGGFDLKSITGYRKIDNDSDFDISGSNRWYIATDVDATQISQEIQALGTAFDSRLDWIVGAFYMYEDSDVDSLNTIGPFSNRQTYNTGLDSYAAFAQATYRVTDKLGVTLGGRYTRDEKDYDGTIVAAGPPSWVSGSASVSDDWSEFTPKLGVDYRVNEDIMTYAYVAKGFQAGGFQARPFSVNDIDTPYDPTTVWTYEGGAKAEFLDRKLRLNVAYYWNDYDDLQLNSLNVAAGGGTITQNAAEAEVHGIEVELMAAPTENLNIFGTIATADNEYKKLAANVSGVTLDSDIAGTPKFTSTLGFDYSFNFSAGTLVVGSDWQHQQSHYPGSTNAEVTKVPTLDLINAYVRFETPEGDWDVGLYGKNLTDEEYHFTGFNFSSFQSVYAADPLTVMAIVNYHYR
ncbi:MAG: TonB-dependent receptor [Gammaproteobacteria bacterium]|nr:TonB-dependent receptor [Gammaproteobacteria bacterium]